MLYRKVPKNGDMLSVLGFGAMRLPAKGRGIDEERAARQIYHAIDEGVNYIDTAYMYHGGKSEPFVGAVLAQDGYRKKVKLATKLPHWAASSSKEMHALLDEQLAKLQTDHIDYYLVHNVNGESWAAAKKHGVLSFLDDALAAGKIGSAGFSYHGSAEDFSVIVDDYDWTFCQIQYNFLDTKNQAGEAGLNYAASRNMAVVVMEPLRGGSLGRRPPHEVARIWERSATKRTPAEWALRWIWNHPAVTVVLSGMNDEAHIKENLAVAHRAKPHSLSPQECELVGEVAQTYRRLMQVPCTSCQYCMPCPAGVNIPGCFEQYNSYHMFDAKQAKFFYLGFLGGISSEQTALASQCTRCGICVKKCPQGIAIPDRLREVTKDMEGILIQPLLWIARKMMKVKRRKTRRRKSATC